MPEFDNVRIIKQANIYYDGNVTSRSVHFADGTVKTLGFMLPGEYEFKTKAKESMEIMSGKLEVLLSESNNWMTVQAGESFDIPADSSFKLKITEPTDYCCSFIN
jgi:uncharacterized protein YaiE (UPF0345 family)